MSYSEVGAVLQFLRYAVFCIILVKPRFSRNVCICNFELPKANENEKFRDLLLNIETTGYSAYERDCPELHKNSKCNQTCIIL